MIVRDPELVKLYECRNRIAWLRDKHGICLQCGESVDFLHGYSWNGYNAHCDECFKRCRKEHDMSVNEYLNRIRIIGKATQEFIEGEED